MVGRSRRLSVAQKLCLVAATFALPIGVLTHFYLTTINESIDFAQLELAGNAYQRGLEPVLRDIHQHQIALHDCAEGKECAAVAGVRERLDREFSALVQVDRSLGTELQFTDEGLAKRDRSHLHAADVQRRWQELSKAAGSSPPNQPVPTEIDSAHAKLAQDVRDMITHAGDTSNLILDPDLDSYYLMDVTLLALPQTQDRTARVAALGRDVLGQNDAAEKARELAVQAAFLDEADLGRVVASATTAMNEDQNFYGVSETLNAALVPALASYRDATKQLIELARQVSEPGTNVDPVTFARVARQAHEASFALWAVAVGELDHLLQRRIDTYKSRRLWALCLVALALVLSCALAWAVSLSIARPLQKLVGSLAPGATLLSESVNRIAETSRSRTATPEEAEIICDELSAHADDMRRVVGELEMLVKGRSQHHVSPDGPGIAPPRAAQPSPA